MGKEKFVYNTSSLQYEKIKETWQSKFFRISGFLCASVLTGLLLTVVFSKFNASPRERALVSEINTLKAQIDQQSTEFEDMSNVLADLQKRDAYAHRVLLGMTPLDEGVWQAGVGGHDEAEKLRQFKNSGDLMASTRAQIEKLKRQMSIQSESLDDVISLAKEKEDRLARIPSIKPVRSDKLARGVRHLSGFGRRIHPIYKVPKMHFGIDFTAPTGTGIQATAAGTVERVEHKKGGYGKNVVINHGNNYKTLYAHMSRIDVKKGDKVERGEVIGLVGNTGASTAPHCHYEVHYSGKKVDPLPYVTDNLTPEEYQQLVNAARSPNQFFDY